jgi:hypothetical protein
MADVEAPSARHESEAYVPRDPDADRDALMDPEYPVAGPASSRWSSRRIGSAAWWIWIWSADPMRRQPRTTSLRNTAIRRGQVARPQPVSGGSAPVGSWTSEGRRIRVFFALDHNGQRRGAARLAEESGERIVIAPSCLQPLGVVTAIGGFRPLRQWDYFHCSPNTATSSSAPATGRARFS